ncbi:MAG TPA: hypothetical protein DCO86_00405 [Spirochaetaceae bacterium]|nr:hypothetical protein [Spirochaetaceae bacterium]
MAGNKEAILSSEKSDDTTDFLDRHVFEPISIVFSHIFIKLGIIPNVITVMSGIFGMAGGILLYFRDFKLNLIGILLEIMAYIFDTCDGQVARITKHCSRYGRMLDGFCDSLAFASMYFALSFRLMNEMIPFTNVYWGLYIWPVSIAAGYSHQRQSAMVDYYRNLHLFLLKKGKGSEFDRSSDLKAEIDSLKGHFAQKFLMKSYCSYTKGQEKASPALQRLLNSVDFENVTDSQWAEWAKRSRKHLWLTKFLAYHPKAIVLYASVLAGFHVVFFPIVIVFFGTLHLIMVSKYEKFANSCILEIEG